MRGLGDFQRAQMRDANSRIPDLFSHIRQVIDILERPHEQWRSKPRCQRLQFPGRSQAVLYDQGSVQARRRQFRNDLSGSRAP